MRRSNCIRNYAPHQLAHACGVMFHQGRTMIRLSLIGFLAVLASANMYLDFARPEYMNTLNFMVAVQILAVGVGTSAPSLAAFLIAAKTKFCLWNINIYKVSADLVLALSLSAWVYLVFIRIRPDFYDGASHLHVVTWPIIIGLLAVLLYSICLSVQFSVFAVKNITKLSTNRQQAG